MPYLIPQPVIKDTGTYIVFKKVLSNEDCKNVIAVADEIPPEPGLTGSAAQKRISDVRWLHHSPETDSLFRKLSDSVLTANNIWKFHLGGFEEPLQLTHYRSELGGHYDWHEDRCDVGIAMNRKISGTLLLNDNFEGGDFELFDVANGPKLQRGDMVLFPSYKVHRVNQVTRGERWSLVFWVSGPSFI